ncbi:acylphosphatase [Virgibacillus ihumii]|uniref:acylphosphatase n=1 Tax=Virgibacillus ihumii TaxID=2686091 RepID=UPI00157CF31F|nr:acylphosphatase [Virgibacillus ihumii]
MLAHVTVTGRVQGVGFRYSAQQQAAQHNLTGWVQNKADGSVELKVEGPEQKVDRFLEEMKAGFTQFIKVKQIDVDRFNKDEGYKQFSIK